MKQYHISHEYNLNLWDGGVCDQGDGALDWLYAPLNMLRARVTQRLRLETRNFQLSTAYLVFYDLFEKSMQLLDAAASAEGEALEALLQHGVDRNGDWNRFAFLADRYGLVPLTAMPDSSHHHRTDAFLVLNNRLRYGVKELLEGMSDRETVMQDVYQILCDGIGTPPESFTFTYRTADRQIEKLTATPLSFYHDFCGTAVTAYRAVTHHGDSVSEYTAQELRTLAVRQLQDGEQVVICCDVRQQATQLLGILDTDFIDLEDTFGRELVMSKEDKLHYGVIQPVHYMSIDGVQLEDGQAVRFRVQDSHGADTGVDGHYTMSADWFDAYVLTVVLNKKYLK